MLTCQATASTKDNTGPGLAARARGVLGLPFLYCLLLQIMKGQDA